MVFTVHVNFATLFQLRHTIRTLSWLHQTCILILQHRYNLLPTPFLTRPNNPWYHIDQMTAGLSGRDSQDIKSWQETQEGGWNLNFPSQVARLAVRPIRPPVVARRKIECSPNDFANIHNPPTSCIHSGWSPGCWVMVRILDKLRYSVRYVSHRFVFVNFEWISKS